MTQEPLGSKREPPPLQEPGLHHQVPSITMGKIHLAKIHTARSQEQHQNPPTNINQVIYLLASGFKRQEKKDVKNMINLT